MLRAIRKFVSDITAAPTRQKLADHRLAAAALLYHVISLDGLVDEAERERLQAVLTARYELDPEEGEDLIEEARAAERDAVDLYRFTSVLKDQLSEAERADIIAMMWEMGFADGELHAQEDNVVWRVSELLGVSSRDRVRLKKAARPGG